MIVAAGSAFPARCLLRTRAMQRIGGAELLLVPLALAGADHRAVRPGLQARYLDELRAAVPVPGGRGVDLRRRGDPGADRARSAPPTDPGRRRRARRSRPGWPPCRWWDCSCHRAPVTVGGDAPTIAIAPRASAERQLVRTIESSLDTTALPANLVPTLD